MEGSRTISGLFFKWWYGEGFPRFLAYIKRVFLYLIDFFSVMACLNTLFYPWKRDQISYDGLALKEKFEAFTMNLVSRLIGAVVKLFCLSAFVVATIAFAVISAAGIVLWYFYPALVLALIILAFFNVRF